MSFSAGQNPVHPTPVPPSSNDATDDMIIIDGRQCDLSCDKIYVNNHLPSHIEYLLFEFDIFS